ncbi:MAG TPA: DMT family transporter [Patescibacteria group bacterium]|nr:DMT family transporter [Patescibacteria group bacterium]
MLLNQFRKLSPRLQGILLLVTAALLWSTSGFFIKGIDWNPMAIAGIRSLIAAFVIRFFFRNSPLQWSSSLGIGAIAYAFTVISFVYATKMTTAANAILLQYTAPVYVAVLGTVFLNEKPARADWITLASVLVGMALFFQDQLSPGGLQGNLLAIASGMSMAVMAVSLRRQKLASPFGSVLWGNILTFLISLPFLSSGSPNREAWLALILLGCFQLGISYVLYAIAIKQVTALEATIITMIEPLLNPLWVVLIIGEWPGSWALAGGAVILSAITARYVLPALKSANDSHPLPPA